MTLVAVPDWLIEGGPPSEVWLAERWRGSTNTTEPRAVRGAPKVGTDQLPHPPPAGDPDSCGCCHPRQRRLAIPSDPDHIAKEIRRERSRNDRHPSSEDASSPVRSHPTGAVPSHDLRRADT